MRLISIQVESAVLRRRKLLKRLQAVNLSPEEGLLLQQRVESNRCSATDYESLIQVIRATMEVAQQLSQEVPVPRSSSPQRKAKWKRQLVKASRRRNRR